MQPPPLLTMQGITKTFPGVRALDAVGLTLEQGEVHAIVGENGAGKSTLIKILAGVHRPDAGTITIDGNVRQFDKPLDALEAGIAVIYQEFNLVPALTVRENMMLGHEQTRYGFFSRRRERELVAAFFERIQVHVDPERLCRDLSVAQQQLVEIARALTLGARILVMDEPTAALTPRETEHLFEIIRDLQGQGIAIIYISHRLEEIFAVAGRVTVLRDGQHIATSAITEVDRIQLIEQMVGRSIDNEFPKVPAPVGEVRLRVDHLTRAGTVEDVSFTLRAGEILGLTGLVGSGRTEVARLIFGADRPDAGTLALDGKEVTHNAPLDAIKNGISLLPEDRKAHGLVLGLSARENFALPNLGRWSRWGWINSTRELARFGNHITDLQIKVSHPNQTARELSGGNQQKVLLARWLEAHARVVIFDEPTRGIDVGAKFEIYQLMNALAAEGKAILMISSELPEVLGMSDRILVMKDGRLSGEVTEVAACTQEELMALAT